MADLLVGAAAALACGAAGLLMPPLLARLPEPEPDPEPGAGVVLTAAQEARRAEPPKELYADLAHRPRVARAIAITAALAGALLGWRVGGSWLLLLVLPLAPLGAMLGVVDLRTRLLPSRVVNPATLAALVYVVVAGVLEGSASGVVRALVGFAIAYGFFWLLHVVYSVGMGYGDVRLAGLLGLVLAYLGWSYFVVGLYLPFLIFGLPGAVLALVRRDRRLLKATFPFGPFLLVGGLIGLVFGVQLLDAL